MTSQKKADEYCVYIHRELSRDMRISVETKMFMIYLLGFTDREEGVGNILQHGIDDGLNLKQLIKVFEEMIKYGYLKLSITSCPLLELENMKKDTNE
jgi:hypothetical protein